MLACANPKDENQRVDGHGIVGFNEKDQAIKCECWSRFAKGDEAQFPGWYVSIHRSQKDGRPVKGYLSELQSKGSVWPVIKVIRERDGGVLYCIRGRGDRFRPSVYEAGKCTIKIGADHPDLKVFTGVVSGAMDDARSEQLDLR